MTKKNLVQITTDQRGNEIIMVRVNKTLKELMEEKPSSRWDVSFWHPDFQNLIAKISNNYKVDLFGDYIESITYGQVGQRVYSEKGSVKYIQTINITSTGVDYLIKLATIDEGSHNDPLRSRLKYGDLLLGNAGMGGLGKVTLFVDKDIKVNISQDIDLIRCKNINKYYVVVYLKSVFGNKQIWIRSRGVGAPKLPFDEIKAIKIPILPDKAQKNIELEYKKMAVYHGKAMESKKYSNEAEYKKNIEIAEKMLKDLIAKTEAVIRGERVVIID